MNRPTKLPDDNYSLPGINMLRDKINEIIDFLEVQEQLSTGCPHAHIKTTANGRYFCEDCKKFVSKP